MLMPQPPSIQPQQQPQKPFPVSWDEFHRDARALRGGSRAPARSSPIVCVSRGGLVPAGDCRARARHPADRDGVRRKLQATSRRASSRCSRTWPAHRGHRSGRGKGVLIVDDLVDTGKTARVVRDILPEAHFATVYAKPMGRPMVDTFITEVSQDTWIYFPWDTGLAFQPPIRDVDLETTSPTGQGGFKRSASSASP